MDPGTRDTVAHLRLAAQRLYEEAPDHPRLPSLLDTLDAHAASLALGQDPLATRTGVYTRAYRSHLDGSLQRYVIAVPPAYGADPERVWPLVVAAHGLNYTPEDMARIALALPTRPGAALAMASPLDFPFKDPGAIVVSPDGYGDAGHRPPGEVDTLRVIDEVRRAYRIDPQRISITGFSLGGSVAFWVPLHYPDVFSAAAPLCGYPNVHEYSSVRYARKRPWEHALLAREGIVNYAEGGRYLPLRMVHGERDNPARSRLMADRYMALKYHADLEILPGAGHNIWDAAYADGALLRWLAKRRRPSRPSRPRVRTMSYRYSASYWLRIDRFDDHQVYAEADATLGKKRLRVTTDNALGISLIGARLGDAAGTRRALVVDGQALGEVTLPAITETLSLSRGAGRWAVVPAPDVPAGHKRRGVEGPLRDVWHGPFVIVYGTQDPAQTEANRTVAESLRRYSLWTDIAMPIKADVDVDDADLRGRGVVLVGNPRSNAVTARLEPDLPVRFEGDAIVLGERRFAGDDVGVAAIHPNPLDPDHYVVVHAGVTAQGTLSAQWLPEYLPDFLVYDGRIRDMWWDRLLSRREGPLGWVLRRLLAAAPRTAPQRNDAVISVTSIIERFRAGQVHSAGGLLKATQAISTQRSVVFLTGELAIKLRRPVPMLGTGATGEDQSTLALRHALARQEVREGRRLSPAVYLGAATLTQGDDGALRVANDPAAFGESVVVMRRLAPEDRADVRLDRRTLSALDLRPLMGQLADYHAAGEPFQVSEGVTPVDRFCARFRVCADRLVTAGRLGEGDAGGLLADVRDHAEALSKLLAHRVAERRIRRVHGAVRLDHLFVGEPPGIIDPLEWPDRAAITDTAEDVALLWLQLATAGARPMADQAANFYAGGAQDGTLHRVLPLFARLAAAREAAAENDDARSGWYLDRALRRDPVGGAG